MRISRIFFWILVVTSVGGGLLLAASFLTVMAPMPGGNLMDTEAIGALTLAAYALFAYAIARVRETGHLPRLLSAALVGTVVGGLAAVSVIWIEGTGLNPGDTVVNVLIAVTALATALGGFGALTGLLAATRLPKTSRWLIWTRRTTITIGAWLALQLGVSFAIRPWIIANWYHESRTIFEVNTRIATILAVLIGCGIIALVAAVYRRRLKGEDIPLVEPRDMTITCPRCLLRQPIRTEGARCAACKLGIRVSLS